MRTPVLFLLAALWYPTKLCAADTETADTPAASAPTPERKPWFRDSGEVLAHRSTRTFRPTEPSAKIITDAKRFDVSVGKRIPLHSWGETSPTDGWSFGADGGMLASLVRYSSEGRLTFATNTFDGMFGLFVGFVNGDGWLAMFRTAHLSSHLVDNSPLILTPIGYSQFWNEIIVGKSFPETRRSSDWDLHLQASLGLNHSSAPRSSQPRASLGADFGYAFHGPDSLGLIASADALRAGVTGQPLSYTFFLGVGYLSRPETTHRPFQAGLVHFRGSDYRNQLHFQAQNWTTFLVAVGL